MSENGVSKTAESIRKKLTIDDYEIKTGLEKVQTAAQKQKSPKAKLSVYISEEMEKKFTKVVYKRKIERGKGDRSSVAAEALELLFEKEGIED